VDRLPGDVPALRFLPTHVAGVLRIGTDPHADVRGLFARLYCPMEYAAAGLQAFQPTQVNLSRNAAAMTLRGMHFQRPPYAEAKLVRVVRGRAFDVAIDLRRGSPSYGKWAGTVLDSEGMDAVFIPEGCAHGFLTLEPDTDMLYQMGRCHVQGQACGVRWDDPAFAVDWPAVPAVIDPRDREWPDWGC
jgi:dTDP-4-dehydrorhamnose 3,5-epimerase